MKKLILKIKLLMALLQIHGLPTLGYKNENSSASCVSAYIHICLSYLYAL